MESACKLVEGTLAKISVIYKFPPVFGVPVKPNKKGRYIFLPFLVISILNVACVLGLGVILKYAWDGRLVISFVSLFIQLVVGFEAVSNICYDIILYNDWLQLNWICRELKKLSKLIHNVVF